MRFKTGGTLIIYLVLSLLVFSSFAASIFNYHYPDTIISGRHRLTPRAAAPSNKLFGWKTESEPLTFVLTAPEAIENLNNNRLVGIKLFTGTSGHSLNSKSSFELHTINGSFSCRSRKATSFVDNAWTTIFFSCLTNDSHHGTQNTRGENDQPEYIQVHLSTEKDIRFAIYAAQSEENKSQLSPAVQFIYSRYRDDKPPKRGSFGLDSVFPWVSKLQLFPLFLVLFVLMLAPAFWIKAALKQQIFSSFDAQLFSRLAFIFWTTLMLGFSIATPPFQNPDEPQHALGVVGSSLERSHAAELRNLYLQAARETNFLDVKQTVTQPILPDTPEKNGFADSDFEVNAERRSSAFAFFARRTLPFYYSIVKSFSIDAITSVWLLRLSLALIPFTLVLASFLILDRMGQVLANLNLLLFLTIPVSTSLFSSVSNYGWSIAVGASCAAFLSASGVGRLQWCFALVCGFLTPLLADSSTPVSMFIFILPVIALGRILYAALTSESDFLTIWREQGPQKLLILFCYPAGFLASSIVFDERWSKIVVPSLLNATRKVINAAHLEAYPTLQSVIELVLRYPIIWVLFLWIGVALPIFEICSRGARRKEVKPTLLRWSATIAFLACSVLTASLLTAKYREPIFAQNIYGLHMNKPKFLDFLTSCFNAFLSQFFHIPQDYFLWQTNFLAYGWLETVAPQPYYFLLKLLLAGASVICIIALIWRTLPSLLIVLLPLVSSWVTWLVLLYGAWGQSHTLLGRYLLPISGFFLLPFVGALELILAGAYRKYLHLILVFIICFFVISSLIGLIYFIPQRFLVGGFG